MDLCGRAENLPKRKKKTMALLKSSVTDGDHMPGSERSEVTLVEYTYMSGNATSRALDLKSLKFSSSVL